jgi:hypothetical protein
MSLQRLRASLAERYAIEQELGAGGMATVYLAHDIKHDRKAAIKVLRPDLGAALGSERNRSSPSGAGRQLVRRLVREEHAVSEGQANDRTESVRERPACLRVRGVPVPVGPVHHPRSTVMPVEFFFCPWS